MNIILTGILLAAILLSLLFYTYNLLAPKARYGVRNSQKLLFGVLLALHLCLYAYIMALMVLTRAQGTAIFFLLLLTSLVSFVGLIVFLVQNRREIRGTMLLCFGLFFLVILYITLLSRGGTRESAVKMEAFGDFKTALETHSWEPISHFLLNALMFVPLGFFLAGVRKTGVLKFGTVALQGLTFSTLIETLQLVTHRGECDLDDIIANTLGAMAGWAILKLFQKSEILR